jgi:hypothetical protein
MENKLLAKILGKKKKKNHGAVGVALHPRSSSTSAAPYLHRGLPRRDLVGARRSSPRAPARVLTGLLAARRVLRREELTGPVPAARRLLRQGDLSGAACSGEGSSPHCLVLAAYRSETSEVVVSLVGNNISNF